MASSKKPRPAAKPLTPSQDRLAGLVDAVQQALHRPGKKTGTVPVVAVAYSGGADSTVLLRAVAVLHQRQLLHAVALHVHHGLSPNADHWLAHCSSISAQLRIPFFAERVHLNPGGKSLEAEARKVRYAALERLCQARQADILLTAHHADDQAETVLLNLLRGAGVAGLAGAAQQRSIGQLILLRPFLEIGAAPIRQLALDQGWPFIEDESNLDKRHTRNALRHEVMPVLKRIFPAAAERMVQTAAHSAEAQALLDDIGREDLDEIGSRTVEGTGTDLHVDGLRKLTRPRAANALRVWFRTQARHAPGTAALNQMLDQLLDSRNDAQISLIHDDLALQVYRGRIYARPALALASQAARSQELVWNGETELALPDWKGQLRFEKNAETGIPVSSLFGATLSVRSRQGGERLKLHPNRPSRSLKNLYQESGIPPWQRSRLPLLYAGNLLIFAAGLGMDSHQLTQPDDQTGASEMLVALSWHADD